MNRNRICALIACCLFGLAIGTSTASAAPAPVLPPGPILPQAEWPNDPGFARCELQDPVSGCKDSEQWNIYGPMDGLCKAPGGVAFDQPRNSTQPSGGGLPCWASNASDPEGASGINMTGAWAQGNLGRDEMLVAYMEGGVNYSSDKIKDGLNAVYLNKGELPYPQGWDGQDLGRYDFDGNGRLDIRDYAKDPRVNPECPVDILAGGEVIEEEGTTRGCANDGQHRYTDSVKISGTKTAYLSPHDLIAVFGKCRIVDNRIADCGSGTKVDNDGNGYPNDISGWNAYNNTNDPQTEDSGYGHASGLMSLIGAEANNNFGDVGVCRECRVLPVKTGAESVGKADNWAPGLTYAVDAGAKSVASVVVSYTYSSAAREAVAYAISKNVLLSFDSNDFDSMDHTDGHLYDQVFPGNSVIQDQGGSDTKTFRARSNVTSYGTHSVFSGGETTTSGATPFQASFLGMVQSAAMDAVDNGDYPRTLTPNEVRQVLMNTASPVVPQVDHPTVPKQWPGNPDSTTDSTHSNWSTQYGYGRVNIGKATKLIYDGKVPPEALITSPSWYKYVDPARDADIEIKGHVKPSAWGSQGIGWTLEWALGADPKDSDFQTISTGAEGKEGVLGTLDVSQIPATYAAKDPANPITPFGPEQYTVSIRLRAVDGNGLKGEDRRSFGARSDAGLVEGFPKSIDTEISAAPTFVDLNGKRQQELVFGTMDGVVSALMPDGNQAPGFPVYTKELREIDPNNPQNFDAASYRSVPALREARDPISGIAVGDLTGNGSQSIVAATTSGWVYAWSNRGALRPGFPVRPKAIYDTKPVPTPMAGNRHRSPTRGNWSAPSLGNLMGNGELQILMSSFDGHVYAWQPNGKSVPGWPVEVSLPDSIKNTIPPEDFFRDPKLMTTPAVGDVLGTGTDQVFLPGFDCDDNKGEVFGYGIQSEGNRAPGGKYLPGWPVRMKSLAGCYSESIDFVQEGGNAASIADFDGSGINRIQMTPVTGFPQIINADGSVYKNLAGSCPTLVCQGIAPYFGADAITVGVTGQGAIGDLDSNGTPEYMQPMAGGVTLSAALDDAGQAALPAVFDMAWNPNDGSVKENFPVSQDGFPFFVSPIVANLTPDGNRSMIASNDSYWIHARGPDGKEAPGFPKWTGQWTSFGGVIGEPKFDGQQYLSYGTREGQIFLWKVGGNPELSNEWSHYRHDEHNSGRYGNDTRPPAGMKVKVKRFKKQAKLTWAAPGNNGVNNGKVTKYQLYRSTSQISLDSLGKASRLKAPKILAPNKTQKIKLSANTKKKFFFAIRAQDSAGNWSQLSKNKVKPFKVNYKLIKKKKKVCKKKFKASKKKAKGNKKKIKRAKKQQSTCIRKAKKAGGLSVGKKNSKK
ncbi:MAG: S8 family serine peptidase [Solirubrobacterales bacterium]